MIQFPFNRFGLQSRSSSLGTQQNRLSNTEQFQNTAPAGYSVEPAQAFQMVMKALFSMAFALLFSGWNQGQGESSINQVNASTGTSTEPDNTANPFNTVLSGHANSAVEPDATTDAVFRPKATVPSTQLARADVERVYPEAVSLEAPQSETALDEVVAATATVDSGSSANSKVGSTAVSATSATQPVTQSSTSAGLPTKEAYKASLQTPTITVDPVNGPVKTIADALKNAQNGDVIQLAAGTYYEGDIGFNNRTYPVK